MATAVVGRRHEFAVGRACAREALSELGVPPCPIPSGLHREPLWPPAVVITYRVFRTFRIDGFF
ncbi:hypothetical protein J6525_37525 [Bradyrhizobium sp. WSM 4400]|nr:hypothetical protein [Bradyrhizobium australafricanum]